MVSQPSQYAAMSWHQSRSGRAVDDGDGWYKPEAWGRPEFHEGNMAKYARGLVTEYLMDAPVALAHIGYLVETFARPPGRAGDRPADLASPEGVRAVRAVATWLDEALYGQAREQFPKEERYSLQVTADSMARGDFCRMDFRALVADCLKVGVRPAAINPRGYGRQV
jgi:hypothetical protein